jgi:hypothetical protein
MIAFQQIHKPAPARAPSAVPPRHAPPMQTASTGLVQRSPSCACGGACPRCQADEREGIVQRQEAEGQPQLQLDPEIQQEMLRLYLRWWLGTTLVEGDAPTEAADAGEGTVPSLPPLPPQLFAPLPPDPLWVPPDWGSLYGAHLGRGVEVDSRDSDLLLQLYRDRLRLAQGLPDLRSMAPSFVRPLIPTTWRRDIAGALTSAAAGVGLKRDYPTAIDISDRAWENMTGAGTTIIPLPSISFDFLGGGR